jgi:cell filamentation protein
MHAAFVDPSGREAELLDSIRSPIVPYMAPEPSKHRDRYDVTGNIEAEYVDADQTVLVNKKGITELAKLQALEEEGLAKAYGTLLAQVRVDTPLTSELTRYMHRQVFGELYEWAGRWRTVNISKPGITWPPPEFIDENMTQWEQNFLRKYAATKLVDDDAFCNAVAEIQGEFLVIHPFREGNARTIKLLTDLLAAQTGRPLLKYDQDDAGRERYIRAASRAFRRNYEPMVEVIRQALFAGKQGPSTAP